MDRVNEELRRTVEFLNACTGPHFDIACAELEHYGTGDLRMLVPTLIGKPSTSKAREAGSVTAPPWTPERFMAEIRRKLGDEAVEVAEGLRAWIGQNGGEVGWGKGD